MFPNFIKSFVCRPVVLQIKRESFLLSKGKHFIHTMSNPRVIIEQGELEGRKAISANGLDYFYFKGIPYAKPPLGELRFKDPIPPEKWQGIRDASKEGNMCSQINMFSNEFVGEEDCLFLNVYTPSLKQEKKLPVMVWIHGGAFMMGCGHSNNPLHMIEKDVVIVFINYRLSVLGFLCAEDSEFPGNAGLKDQVQSLRWINKNIEKFGGDPNNVTIFGGSAGGASTHFLMLSPMTKGLIHKAIFQSGSAFCPWTLNLNPINNLKRLASILGHNSEDTKSAVKFLQTVPVNELIPAAVKTLSDEDFNRFMPSAFLPVIETKFPNVESFLTIHPIEILKKGLYPDIPVMAGFSSKEAIFLFDRIDYDANRCTEAIKDLRYFIPPALNIPFESLASHKIAEQISQLYFDKKEITVNSLQSIIDLISDFMFKHGTDIVLRTMLKHSKAPIYYYEFSHTGNHSRQAEIAKKFGVDKAAHSDENCYLFSYKQFENVEPNLEDILTRDRIITMWTDFAKFGNPTPVINELITTNWLPITNENVYYLDIGHDLDLKTDPYYDKLKFWNQLYE